MGEIHILSPTTAYPVAVPLTSWDPPELYLPNCSRHLCHATCYGRRVHVEAAAST